MSNQATITPVKAEFPEKLYFLFEPKRYKIAYGGRGGSKSWGFARALLLLGAEKPLRILCARETQKSIAESVHRTLSEQINLLGLGGFYTVLKSTVVGANGTEFIFAGIKQQVHNLKSYEGCDICWVEEAQAVSRHSWEVLIPTIRKDGSEIWVSFNPDLATDETYRRFVVDPPPPEVATVVFIRWSDNPWFPARLQEEKDRLKSKDPDAYEHVYEGVCKQAVDGAVYRSELQAAEKDNRITRVPYDPVHPVHTFWDLGFGDNTAIWFAQSVGFEFRLIDYISGCQQGLQYYLGLLQSKRYVYGSHYLPWDACSKMMAVGRTIQEQLATIFPGKVEIVPKLTVADGIAAARAVFPRCWFDAEKCYDGIQGLRHYRYELDEKLGTFKREPLHDWASHPADAFRMMAVTLTEPKRKQESERRQQYMYPGQTGQRWMG